MPLWFGAQGEEMSSGMDGIGDDMRVLFYNLSNVGRLSMGWPTVRGL